jgi:hypothetical protein
MFALALVVPLPLILLYELFVLHVHAAYVGLYLRSIAGDKQDQCHLR